MTDREEALRRELEDGRAVVVNLATDSELIRWAKDRDLYRRVDRRSNFGNPFHLGRDGDRDEACRRFDADRLPELIADLEDLRGKALGCWCSPKRCHADSLAREVNDDPVRSR